MLLCGISGAPVKILFLRGGSFYVEDLVDGEIVFVGVVFG